MTINEWVAAIIRALSSLWDRVVNLTPSLIGAVVVFIIGSIVAVGLEKIIQQLVHHLRLDHLLKQLGAEQFMERAGLKLDAGVFFGRLVYWFIFIAFLLASSDILGFTALSRFLNGVLDYLPNVFIASLILIATLVAAKFISGLVRASVLGAKLHAAKTLSTIAWWGVFVFGFLAALQQLGVATGIIESLVTGLIAMIALAGGLAFGLGGRDLASHWLSKLEEKI